MFILVYGDCAMCYMLVGVYSIYYPYLFELVPVNSVVLGCGV